MKTAPSLNDQIVVNSHNPPGELFPFLIQAKKHHLIRQTYPNAISASPVRTVVRSLAYFAALLLQLGCAAGKPAESDGTQPPSKPSSRTIQINPLFYGDAPNLEYDVPVRNESDRTVRFGHIRMSCACAGTTRLESMELPPGQETVLHFHIDLRQRKGPQRFVCTLVEVDGAEWTYALETVLYERARFAEVGPFHFGMVDPGAEGVRSTDFCVHAENSQELPEVVGFRTDSESVRVESEPGITEQLPDGTTRRKFPLRIYVRAPEISGLGGASIVAEIERRGAKDQVQVGVNWNVRSIYSVEPQQI